MFNSRKLQSSVEKFKYKYGYYRGACVKVIEWLPTPIYHHWTIYIRSDYWHM